MRLMWHLAPWWRWSCFGPGCERLRDQRLKHILSALDRRRISPTLLSLRVGRPSGWLDPRGWANPTPADRSEARVDHLVNRPGPVVSLEHFHPVLAFEVEVAGLSAGPVLVEISRQMAATMDSKVTIA